MPSPHSAPFPRTSQNPHYPITSSPLTRKRSYPGSPASRCAWGSRCKHSCKVPGLAARCTGDPTWWLRPGATVLARIQRKTGTDAEKLLSMTFAQWEPVIQHDDDIVERFYPPRQLLTAKARRQSAQQIMLCTQCLRDDTEPYLRLHWMLGWTALCPRHATVLTSRCPHCQASLKLAELMSPCAPPRCGRCHAALTSADTRPAHEQAVRLQAALLAGKRHGSSELAGPGMMSWPLVPRGNQGGRARQSG
jgi:hypothetical protein